MSLPVDQLIAQLQICRQKKALSQAKLLLGYMRQHHLDAHPVLGNHLVPMLVECGSLDDARHVFDRLPLRNAYSWISLISGYARTEAPQHAFHLYHEMQTDNIQPQNCTYLVLLKACARTTSLENGHELHADLAKRGLEGDLFISSTMVDMYGKCGFMSDARLVFDKLSTHDSVSWNALIAGYAEQGLRQETDNCVKEMQLEGISPDAATFVSSLKVCRTIASFRKGQCVHSEIIKRGLEMASRVANTLVDMYAKCKLVKEARQVFDKLPHRDAISWATLISGYTEHGFHKEVLSSFHEMQLQGIVADEVVFIHCLKACSTVGALETGREIHREVKKAGLQSSLFVANSLVDMYGKCGSISEAHQVFENLPHRDAISWNALISGYAEHGYIKEVHKCLEQMQLEGISPDVVTLLCSLKACAHAEALSMCWEVHLEIARRGFDSTLHVGNSLVDTYSKCNSVLEARRVFDMLPVQDAVAWSALISGYSEHGLHQEVLNCFKQVPLMEVSVDAITFVRCLKACSVKGALDTGQEIHAEVRKVGLGSDILVCNTLIDMFCKCGSVVEARKVFEKIPVRDVVSWNVLIAGYYEQGFIEEAFSCFEQMQLEGVSPDDITFLCCLKACQGLDSNKGRVLHDESVKRGFERDHFVGSTLVDMYASLGFLGEAQKVFDQLPERSEVPWTALITGYMEQGLADKALSCFRQMQLEGVSPDAVTFTLSLNICGIIRSLETGYHIHAETIIRGLENGVHIGSTLVYMYARCGLLTEAKQVFDMLTVRDVHSWDALTSGYAEHGLDKEVLHCFKQMQLAGISADAVIFIRCLKACGTVGALETGREIHAAVRNSGLEGNLSVGNMLIDMYGKCGALAEGQEVFDTMLVRDTISWTAMIKGYGENHQGSMAVQCFEEMLEQGVKPDGITFTCLLAACSHASLVFKGQKYFKLMDEEYKIEPTLDHYACMVDLLARSGQLHEAEKIFNAAKCFPSKNTIRALLTACKVYGKVEVGLRCFQHLLELDQDDASAYLLMADTYANAVADCAIQTDGTVV